MKVLQSVSLILATFFLATEIISQTVTIPYSLEIPIISGADDVEENADGGMYMNSTDLELTEDGNQQTVGLHFKNINLPAEASILSVSIQFTSDELSSSTTDLQISAELASNASIFLDTPFNISDRPKTVTTIDWSVPAWTTFNTSAAAQRTPDLSEILEEVLNSGAWQAGNAINFIFEGTGKRTAHAFEGVENYAAKLNIEAEIEVFTGNLENIFINELMAANEVVFDNFGEADDWLEIYNANDTPISLEGIFLSDDANDLMKWQIETPIIVPANGFVLFWLDDAPEQGNNHVPFKLSSGGESVFISQIQDGALMTLDFITYENLAENVSFGRAHDGENDWVLFGEYSPQESNNGKGQFLDANVEIFPKTGSFPADLTITMQVDDPEAEIRYTTDGSQPTPTSTLFTGAPVFLEEPTVVQAAAFKPGFVATKPANEFFLIGNDHDLPVIQLTFEPKHFFDEEEGIYVSGTNGVPGYCSNDDPHNWNQDWERPVSVRYLTTEDDVAFLQEGVVKIGGGCSRAFQQKGLNFFFRDGKKIDYPLFEQLPFEEYKRFKLRASGNDFTKTFIRDAAIQAMLQQQVDIDLMAYQPVVAYLNGAYWGIYGVREFFNKHYLEAHHGIDKDNLDLLKNPYNGAEIKEGDLNAWNELTDFISNNSLENGQAYGWVTQRLDVNEFINYHAAQIYITNYDWPANNVTVWRDKNGGKFRWMLFDLDLSSNYGDWVPGGPDYDAIGHATNEFGFVWPNGPASTLLIRRMFENEDFKHEFSQRICTFGQTIFEPARAEFFIDSLRSNILTEIPAVLDQWNNPPPEFQFWESDPIGGTTSNWLANLSDFEDFFAQRLPFMMDNFADKFDYSGEFNLTINFDEETNGTVVFHQNEMSIPYNYSGNYFQNVPLKIKAIPKDGYFFVRWEETGVTDAEIDFVANSDSELTPIFSDGTTSTDEMIGASFYLNTFPNPVQEKLNIQVQAARNQRAELKIIDLLGRTLSLQIVPLTTNQEQFSLDLSDLEAGIYQVELWTEEGKRVQPFVKL